MQFRFKIQQYQADAAKAVTDVFTGQPKDDGTKYLRDLGRTNARYGQEQISGFEHATGSDEGYRNADILLPKSKLLDNLHAVQRRNRVAESTSLYDGPGAVSLDVEMETGTGKTYVYTKTMFELNRLYGWSKFIIVVPSVAIREGVYKSLGITRQHFFEQYGKLISFFTYNSSRLNELDSFSQSPDICAMIINMQAFNTSMNEDKAVEGRRGDKAARIIFDERDEFGSRKPIEVIAANHPIVIVDEPQKMGKENSATWRGIRKFEPLFTLNYSATHRTKHDCVYVLDALDAFNQRLVKRIEVKGFELHDMRGTDGYLYLQDIKVYKDKGPEAVIEIKQKNPSGTVRKRSLSFREGDSIYAASAPPKSVDVSGLEAYRGLDVSEIVPDQNGLLGYVRLSSDSVDLTLFRGKVYGDSTEKDIRRVQIRETIRSHLEKEEVLFARGIKCLSLFFIDEVAKYRAYGEDGEPELGEYGRVFEEEYREAVRGVLEEQIEIVPGYHDYLRSIEVERTHNGYFSVDKKGRSVDSKVKRGSDESDDESAYDLILRDKERLLSFDEPTRFIFSHSALREGWDNPNVFQICTLKASGSETSKRQEVGRGMRLCVNQEGERQDAASLGETEVQQVNLLTVIASESYSDFVRGLQDETRDSLHERPKRVTEALFRGLTVQLDGEMEYTFSEADAKEIVWALTVNRLIDKDGVPTDKFREQRLDGLQDEDLSEHLDGMTAQIAAVVASVYDEHALDGIVSNGLESKVKSNPLNANFGRREFQRLWGMINSKHAYTVSFDDEELRRKAIDHINDELVVGQATYTVTTGTQREQQSRESLERRDAFQRSSHRTQAVGADESSVTYDLLGEVAQAATITRRSAAHILSGISPHKFAYFRENPEVFIAQVAKLIREAKATMIVDHISYHRLEDRYDSDIFTERMPENMSRALQPSKSVQDYVFWDSDGERKFAEDLESASEVEVFAKLPRTFQIPTPVGNYAPDWAIAFEEGSVRHVFFVAETKGSMSTLDLRPIEKAKIACAKKLFNELSTDDVRYHEVTGYQDLLKVIAGMD